jgi:hypothetical protein
LGSIVWLSLFVVAFVAFLHLSRPPAHLVEGVPKMKTYKPKKATLRTKREEKTPKPKGKSQNSQTI